MRIIWRTNFEILADGMLLVKVACRVYRGQRSRCGSNALFVVVR